MGVRLAAMPVVVVALAACGFGGGPAPSELPASVSIRQQALPITDLLLRSAEDDVRVEFEATGLLERACMAEHGFLVPRDPWQWRPLDDRRYGLTDLEEAKEFGPRPGWWFEVEEPLPSAEYYESLPSSQQRAYDVALFGSDDEQVSIPGQEEGVTLAAGCIGYARDRLFGSPAAGIRYDAAYSELSALEETAYRASEADARVQSAIRSWSECMAGKGFDVRNLEELGELRAGGDVPEIDSSVAQVVCNDETDLVEIWSGVEAELQQRLFDENEGLVQEYLALREQLLENARALVASAEGDG